MNEAYGDRDAAARYQGQVHDLAGVDGVEGEAVARLEYRVKVSFRVVVLDAAGLAADAGVVPVGAALACCLRLRSL